MDDLTGFELTYIMELPEPWGIIAVWGFVLPVVYLVSSALTNLVLRDFLILKARPRARYPPRPRPHPTRSCGRVPCVIAWLHGLHGCRARACEQKEPGRMSALAEGAAGGARRGARARAQGPCPNCNTENFTYFGDIFTVKGNRLENTVDCRECKARLTFRAEERSVRPRAAGSRASSRVEHPSLHKGILSTLLRCWAVSYVR